MSHRSVLLIPILLLLAACTAVQPKPGPDPVEVTPAVTNTQEFHTPTPSVTSPASPSSTSSPDPTQTPYPTDLPPFDTQSVVKLGSGSITHTATSPDGNVVVIGYGTGQVVWLDAHTGSRLGSIQLGDQKRPGFIIGRLRSVIFSQDNRLMVLVFRDEVRVIDRSTNQQIVRDEAQSLDGLTDVVLSRDNRYLVYREVSYISGGGGYERLVSVSIPDGKRMPEFAVPPRPDGDERDYTSYSAPAISSDSRWMAAGTTENSVFVWDVATGERRWELKGHAAYVSAVAFQPDGQLLASASMDGTVRLWDINQGMLRSVISGFKNSLRNVQFKDAQHLLVQPDGFPAQLVDLNGNDRQESSPHYPAPHPLVLAQYQAGFVHSEWDEAAPIFSPSRNHLAVLSEVVQIWDLTTRQVVSVITGGEGEPAAAAAFSPDGQQIAVAFANHRVQIRLVSDGSLVRELHPPGPNESRYGRSLAFSPDGQRLAVSDPSQTEVFDLTSGQPLLTFPAERPDFEVSSLTFSTDSRYLYCLMRDDHVLQVWDVNVGKRLRHEEMPNGFENRGMTRESAWHWPWFARFFDDLSGPQIELRNMLTGEGLKITSPDFGNKLRFTSDGRLIIARINSQLYAWKTDTGELALISGPLYRFWDTFAVSSDSKMVTLSSDGQIELWNVGTLLSTIHTAQFTPVPLPTEAWRASSELNPTPVPTLAITPMATPSLAQNAIAPQTAGAVKAIGRFGDGTITWAGWSQDGQQIFIAGSHGVSGYDAISWDILTDLRFPLDRFDPGFKLVSLVQDPQGHLLAAGTLQDQVQVWDLTLQGRILSLTGQNPMFSSDGRYLLFANLGGVIYDLQTLQPVIRLPHHPDILSPNHRWAAEHAYYGVRIWETTTGTIWNALSNEGYSLKSLSFSPDGRYLAAVAGSQVYLWENQPGADPREFAMQETGTPEDALPLLQMVRFSPDGQRLAVASTDGLIVILDRTTGQTLQTVGNVSDRVQSLAFHPNGQKLLTVTVNGQISVWDLSSPKPVQRILPAHYASPLTGLVFGPTNQLYAWGQNLVLTLRGNDVALLSSALLPNGKVYAVSPTGAKAAVERAGKIELWPLPAVSGPIILEGEPLSIYAFEELKTFTSGVFNSDGSRLGITGTGGIWVYETVRGEWVGSISEEYASWMAFHPTEQFIVSDTFPYLLESTVVQPIQPGKEAIAAYKHGDNRIFLYGPIPPTRRGQALFTPDGQQVVQILYRRRSTLPDELNIWNAADGKWLRKIDLIQEAKIVSFALDPTGQIAATGMEDGRILLVELTSGKVLTTLYGHTDQVSALAFSQDGQYLASVGKDALVTIWGVR